MSSAYKCIAAVNLVVSLRLHVSRSCGRNTSCNYLYGGLCLVYATRLSYIHEAYAQTRWHLTWFVAYASCMQPNLEFIACAVSDGSPNVQLHQLRHVYGRDVLMMARLIPTELALMHSDRYNKTVHHN